MNGRPVYIDLDGKLVPADEGLLEELTPGRLKGRGVFETMRYTRGGIFLLERHIRRLAHGSKALGIPLPAGGFRPRLRRVLAVNGLQEARIRWMVWRSGKAVHSVVMALVYHPYPAHVYRQGFKIMLAVEPIRRLHSDPGVKSLQYRFFYKAAHAAHERGYDEILFFNKAGQVAEGSRSNVFFIKGRTLMTPAMDCGCLKGITRGAVWTLAGAAGFACRQVRIKAAEMFEMEEIFLTNSLMGIMPVTLIGRRPVAEAHAGPRTRRLMRGYEQWRKEYVSARRNNI